MATIIRTGGGYQAGYDDGAGTIVNNFALIYSDTKSGNHSSAGSYTFTSDYNVVFVVLYAGGEGGDSVYGTATIATDTSRLTKLGSNSKWNGNDNAGGSIYMIKSVKSGDTVSFGSFGPTGGGGILIVGS